MASHHCSSGPECASPGYATVRCQSRARSDYRYDSDQSEEEWSGHHQNRQSTSSESDYASIPHQSGARPDRPIRKARKRRCPDPLRGNFTSFFWDAHAEMMEHSFSSNGSFCDYSDSDVEERYCNVKDPRSLGTAGDSGVASSCSSSSEHSSTIYTQIRSVSKGIRRTRSSSTLSGARSTILSGAVTKGVGGFERASTRRYLPKERRRGERREESPLPRKTPVRGTYASASFHTSRVSKAPSSEGRYNVKKRKIYEEFNVSTTQPASSTSQRPCCWECFEARVEKERVSAGLPARTAYLPEPMVENYYENISFDASDASSAWTRGNRSLTVTRSACATPAVPPRQVKPRRTKDDEEDEEMKSESDTYARLCSIEFSKLHAADSLFSQERLASLQRKIERLLLVQSEIDLSAKNFNEADFAKASNQVVYRIERRLRAIEAYSQPQFKKITAQLISLLASAEKKQKSKMDSFKRGIARAVKVIF